jgi:hypothetical protein
MLAVGTRNVQYQGTTENDASRVPSPPPGASRTSPASREQLGTEVPDYRRSRTQKNGRAPSGSQGTAIAWHGRPLAGQPYLG